MSAAPTFPWPEIPAESIEKHFRSIFEHSPQPVARCNHLGIILQTNPAFELALNGKKGQGGTLQLSDVLSAGNRVDTNELLRDILHGSQSSVHVEGTKTSLGWAIWRMSEVGSEQPQALLLGESTAGERLALESFSEKDLLQAQRWEAVGRLTGGVVHDFNNLLTGVMLYCDLLLGSLEGRDRRLRRFAEEIRGAVAQATAMVRQLLVFARSKDGVARPVSFNEVAETMRDLLARLIGENIELELRLGPLLGLVEIDRSQAEQVLLNLILNARDALSQNGRIVVETGNCRLEQVKGSGPAFDGVAFPYVLLAVSDNGCGMDAVTRERLFEPFYTTKPAGTGLGLTTIRSIVTGNRGLIHVESAPGRGTRFMILLPQSSPVAPFPHLAASTDSTQTTLQEVKKESHL